MVKSNKENTVLARPAIQLGKTQVKSSRVLGPVKNKGIWAYARSQGEPADCNQKRCRQRCNTNRKAKAAINDTERRRLASLEKELAEICHRLEACGSRSEEDQLQRDIDDLVNHELSWACGYSGKANLDRISSDFKCCELHRRSQWGRNMYEQNEQYSLDNHVSMVRDRVRVDAYTTVLDRKASGLRVLDVGTGPFCLLSRLALWAGAASVDCVEQNGKAVDHAIELFLDEVEDKECKEMCCTGASLASLSSLQVHAHHFRKGRPSLSLTCKTHDSSHRSSLQLFQGFSSDVPLPGGYDVVVHEILGHIASSEGVVDVVMNLRQRGLLSQNCIFIPCRAMTFFAPTEQLDLSCLERIFQSFNTGRSTISRMIKYNVNRFPESLLLAAPACFEDLDLSGDLHAHQHYVREFHTNRSAVFDGFHFHMFVDMDGISSINTLYDQTSWRTVYIRVLDPGIFLPAGSRIVCRTRVELDCSEPRYSIKVSVGQCGYESHVAEYTWSGC